MDLDLLRHIVADIDRWPTIESIWLTGFGEPLLHPDYHRCVEILDESEVAQRARVILRADLSILTGEGIGVVDAPILKRLVISFDALSEESCESAGEPRNGRVLRDLSAALWSRRSDLGLTVESRFAARCESDVPARRLAQAGLEEILSPLGIEVRSCTSYDVAHVSAIAPVYGGCPFVEDDSVCLTVDGLAQPCAAVYDPEFNIGSIREVDLGSLLNNDAMCALRKRLRLDQRMCLPYCGACRISLGGEFDQEQLQQYWVARDGMAAVDALDERRYIFGSVAPTAHRARRLDIGGAGSALPGFISLDRFGRQDVDVVADFSQGLPFQDCSFDLVFASNSLEHASDLLALMREIYRVAKDRAQVVILAPYYMTTSNLSNPYHLQAFTEDTPRFWTNSPTSLAGMDQATARHWLPQWGLAESDRSEAAIDLRCMRMQFFYFPEYQSLPAEEQTRLRHTQLNVCDQIMYHLLVVKTPLRDEEEVDPMKTMQFYEPPYTVIRTQNERIRAQNERIETLLGMVAARDRENGAAEAARQVELSRLAADLEAERKSRDAAEATRQVELSRFAADLEAERKSRDVLAQRFRELEEKSASLDAAVQAAEDAMMRAERVAKRLADEISEAQASRLLRWMRRMRPGVDWRGRMGPEFQQLFDDSVIFGRGTRDAVLRPSAPLSEVPFQPYDLALDRPGWCGVTIAPLLDLVEGPGEIACEIVGPRREIIRHVRLPIRELRDLQPLRFSFDPIADSDIGSFEMRIAVSGPQIKARVLEWRRPVLLGLRPAKRKPFCAFHFQ